MKKLLLFSAVFLGSVSLAAAQSGKKARETKKVEQTTKTEPAPAPTAARSRSAQKTATPPAALSLFDATKPAATDKKN